MRLVEEVEVVVDATPINAHRDHMVRIHTRSVAVDGEAGKILKANHYYRAVQLGPGEHILEFDYFPEGFREGLIVTGITPILGLTGYAFWRRRLKKGS